MKTRSTPNEPDNIAAAVKARQRSIRINQLHVSSLTSGGDLESPPLNSGGPLTPTGGHPLACLGSGQFVGCVSGTGMSNQVGQQSGPGAVGGPGGTVCGGQTSADGETANGPIVESKKVSAERKKVTGSSVRRKHAKPFWSPTEKRLFFQGLRLYGKNFNEISRFIRIRVNQPEVLGKTREQVRFFYHRTWHAIRPFLSINGEVSNLAHELYGLINYSVIRNRIKKQFSARLGEKLNELVQTGTTFVRHNGKRYILRTPICPALKRLNNMRAPSQEYLLPDNVTLEIVPRNQASLLRVQVAEQNPRVRFKVSINRQLSDVIGHLETKWMTATQRVRSALGLPSTQSPRVSMRLVSSSRLDGALAVQEVARIRSVDVALKAYQERLQAKDGQIPSEDENSSIKLDLKAIGQKMKDGVDFEAARDVKLLVLYIAMGCPEVIRFEYDYVTSSDKEAMTSSVGNALRRLLHLSSNDWVEYKKKKNNRDVLEAEIDRLKGELDSLRSQLGHLNAESNTTSSLAYSSLRTTGSASSSGADSGYGDRKPGSGDGRGTDYHCENYQEDRHSILASNPIVDDNQDKVLQQLAGLTKMPIVVQRQLNVCGPPPPPHSSLASLKAFNASRVRQRCMPPPPGPPSQVNQPAQRKLQTNQPTGITTKASVTSFGTNLPTLTACTTAGTSGPITYRQLPDIGSNVDCPLTDPSASPARGILEQAYKMSVLCDASSDSLNSFLNHLPSPSPHTESCANNQTEMVLPDGDSSMGLTSVNHCDSNLNTPQHSIASSPRLSTDVCGLSFTNLLGPSSPVKTRVHDDIPDAIHTMVTAAVDKMMNESSSDMGASLFDLDRHLYGDSNTTPDKCHLPSNGPINTPGNSNSIPPCHQRE